MLCTICEEGLAESCVTEKEQNPSGLQAQWQSRCWLPRGNSQEASSIRHFLLDQVLWDTPHLQADLGHPATSRSVQPSHSMEREPRLIKASLSALVSRTQLGFGPGLWLDHHTQQEPGIRKERPKPNLETWAHSRLWVP